MVTKLHTDKTTKKLGISFNTAAMESITKNSYQAIEEFYNETLPSHTVEEQQRFFENFDYGIQNACAASLFLSLEEVEELGTPANIEIQKRSIQKAFSTLNDKSSPQLRYLADAFSKASTQEINDHAFRLSLFRHANKLK